ncbi:MAG: hypothetical protein HOY79_31825 [Streptomyces sp.]|nr:hypothetical protein [Streptomyces sp.]
MNRTARTISTSVAAGGIGLLLTAAGLGLAPAALADSGPHPLSLSLSAPAPAELGLAGQPVEYTDTVTNTGSTTTDELVMRFVLDGGPGLPPNAASLEYRTETGVWKPVPLEFNASTFYGTLPPTFTLEPGASRAVHLRIGLPMGTPHNGDSNGGTQSLKVHTTVARGASGAAAALDDHVIKVDGPSPSLSGVPASVTAGGPGVTFDAKVSNPTASAYKNLSHLLLTDTHAIVQVSRMGRWTTLEPTVSRAEPGTFTFTLDGKDSSLGAHTETVTKVRLSYVKSGGGAHAKLTDCLLVNAGADPLSGTTFCDKQTPITVKPAAAPSGSPTPTATYSPTTTATPATAAQLAKTGSNGTSAMAVGAGALMLAGAAAVSAATLRRRSHR